MRGDDWATRSFFGGYFVIESWLQVFALSISISSLFFHKVLFRLVCCQQSWNPTNDIEHSVSGCNLVYTYLRNHNNTASSKLTRAH
jgi:hypothetical protein